MNSLTFQVEFIIVIGLFLDTVTVGTLNDLLSYIGHIYGEQGVCNLDEVNLASHERISNM